jgi:hypothetical protein
MSESTAAKLRADYSKLVPAIWTALRFLGVYITIVASSATVENLATMFRIFRSDLADHSAGILLEYLSPKFFGDALYLAAGLYLIFGGGWLIENVFLPTKAAAPDDEVDSN